MNLASRLVSILEKYGTEHVFGIPGEQILPFYVALKDSDIDHILTRHEQSAVHAADVYYRSSLKFGVCIATASPGALNMVMAAATAFKDNIPILIITGDNPTSIRDKDYFQSFPLSKVFSNVAVRSFNPKTPKKAILNFRQALEFLTKNPQGPFHINLSKDILLMECEDIPYSYTPDFDYSNVNKAQEIIGRSEKPLIIAGAGALSSQDILKDLNIPIATTFPANGLEVPNLGFVGSRASNQGEYAFKNSDCIIALGTRLSERTLKMPKDNIIQVNINKKHLKGSLNIHGDVKTFLNKINFKDCSQWLNEILKVDNDYRLQGIKDNSFPLKPQSAIDVIYKHFSDNIVLGDAGSHTTWATLLNKSKYIFSGALAPMGFGLSGAIGAATANPEEQIIVISGDGDIQMNIQELATIREYGLNIVIFILNNSEYGIIRQYEENIYNIEPYQVDLKNPDFIKIANAYDIKSKRVDSRESLDELLKIAKLFSGPMIIEVVVDSEDIPMPK